MQKRKILIPLAVSAMMLPLAANAACSGANAWSPNRYGCGVNTCYTDCCDDAACCIDDMFGCDSGCCSVQTGCKPVLRPGATPIVRPTAAPTVAPTAAPTAKPEQDTVVQSTSSAEVLRQVNEYRAQNGLSALSRNAELDRAAAVRAAELAKLFSHTRPDGSSWSTVSSLALGENIAKGYTSADKVMAAWMNSSGHRANILRSSYGSIGIAAVEINGTMYWVQLFGK